jgi:hypothetical protein
MKELCEELGKLAKKQNKLIDKLRNELMIPVSHFGCGKVFGELALLDSKDQ